MHVALVFGDLGTMEQPPCSPSATTCDRRGGDTCAGGLTAGRPSSSQDVRSGHDCLQLELLEFDR